MACLAGEGPAAGAACFAGSSAANNPALADTNKAAPNNFNDTVTFDTQVIKHLLLFKI
jgi:hypothetical protein